MPWLYTALTVIVGLFFWVRTNHRVWYGLSEIVVAFGLMYLAYFPHGGRVALQAHYVEPSFLDVLTGRTVPLFASVYAFVRGCDNFLSGLQERDIIY
jgi:hypothetical protein